MDTGAEETIESSPDEQSDAATAPKIQKRGGRYGKGKSAVWNHFEYDVSRKKSKCRHCSYESTDKLPSNLDKHLKNRHPDAHADVVKRTTAKRESSAAKSTQGLKSFSTQLTLPSFVQHKDPYSKDSKKHKEIMEALAVLFGSQSLPHLLVESTEFRYLVSLMDPRFELPNRRRLSNEISNLRVKIEGMIIEEIKDIQKITIITDIWTKKGLSESYLGILAKYMKPKCAQVRLALLGLEKIEGSHTAVNVFKTLKDVLSKWKIEEEKILYYVTDSGANMVAALKECMVEFTPLLLTPEDDSECLELFEEGNHHLDASFEEIEQEATNEIQEFESLECDYDDVFSASKRLSCVAHRIACILRKCVDQSRILHPTIAAAHRLVRTIAKSVSNKEALLKYNGRSLLSPSQTRWIYTYYVIERLIESKEAVDKVIAEKDLSDVALDALRWKHLGHVRDILKPFADVVKELEGDRYATLSQVVPALIDLIEFTKERGKVSTGFGSVSSEIQHELEKKFGYILNSDHSEFQPAYMIATFLDPRFAIGLTKEQRNLCSNLILQSLQNPACPVASNSMVESLSQQHGQDKYAGFFKRAQRQQSLTPPTLDDHNRFLKGKLEAYVEEILQIPPAAEDKKFCPLNFWWTRQDTFKNIATYAMNILSVSASSAGIERIFSVASVVQSGRYRLSAKATENELMIKTNRDFVIS